MSATLLKRIMEEGADRRRFLRGAGVGAAGLATAFAGGALSSSPSAAQAPTDAQIFAFALNFEYLGAEYYLASLGSALPSGLTGGGGPVSLPPNALVPFQNTAVGYFAQQLANDELAHVAVIREVLGSGLAIPEPSIDINQSWTNLAIAAGLLTSGQTFNPYASETSFLVGAYILEDVCITALCGAAALIQNKTNLAYAASILGVEGYQVGLIRSRLSAIGGDVVTDAISALRSKLANAIVAVGTDDNGTDDGRGNPFNFTNVDVNGQAFRRTPQQVLNIAYGGGATSGGFFPNGVNGSINASR